MYNENKYINDYHGLELNEGFEIGIRDNENGIHFLVVYYLLKRIKKELTPSDVIQFQMIVDAISSYDRDGNKIKGLYDRGAGESLSSDKHKIRKISHDNLSAIVAFSKLFEDKGMSYHKDIAKHGLKHQMRYDNASPENPRWIYTKNHTGKKSTTFQWHPRDWFFWLTSGNYKIGWVFFPIFFMANIITCLTPINETSGKILAFVRLESGSDWSKLIMFNKKICYFLLRKKYGVKFIDRICKIYFWQNSNSPIRLLVKGLEIK